jgi:ribosomal protein S18 acetylase RimI-like enzyme
MDNSKIIEKFQDLENDTAYSVIEKGDYYTIIYKKDNSASYENCAIVNKVLTPSQLNELESKLKVLHRIPTIYFESNENLMGNRKLLQERGYSQKWRDSWLFYEQKIEQLDDANLKIVSTDEEFEMFLHAYKSSYVKDDPQNPYGEVDEYIPNVRQVWEKYGRTNRITYMMALQDEKAVAVSMLTSLDGFGYISAVGSIPEVRGEGYGKAVSLFAVSESQHMGNKYHFLLTEEDTYPYDFYKRIGFIPKFSGIGFVKE